MRWCSPTASVGVVPVCLCEVQRANTVLSANTDKSTTVREGVVQCVGADRR